MHPYYVTTPIYYVNDRPHIGHAYSTVAADVLARYHKLRGRPTRFLTGTDEHGLKIERSATERGLSPQAFVDQMAPPFREMCDDMSCAIDDFIRTTEPRHEARVQAIWRRLEDKGAIYLGHYEDWYCVRCEAFYTEKDLIDERICPTHKQPVERIKEESYFFKLSEYTEPLLAFYEQHPAFVRPTGRYNEVKSFVSEGLRDLSISRTSFQWGVPVPGNAKHVMYVWLDALTNYVSALGGPAAPGEEALFDRFWPPTGEAVHIVGKDILRFHAIYWPAFLLAADVAPPTQVWAHGWLTINGEKMSKSLGNFLPPKPLCDAFGTDVLRYYLMRDVGFGQDGDFSHRNLIARYHGELGNGLGNLLNRMVGSIVAKNLGGAIPAADPAGRTDLERGLIEVALASSRQTAQRLDDVAPHRALEAAWELVSAANRYVDQTAPWALAKEGKTERLNQVVYTVLECLRMLGTMLWPFMPGKANALLEQLGVGPVTPVIEQDQWPTAFGALPAGQMTAPAGPIFPRFDAEQEARILAELGVGTQPAKAPTGKQAAGKAPPSKAAVPSVPDQGTKAGVAAPGAVAGAADGAPDGSAGEERGLIEFGDFAKIELRVGRIDGAEAVPKSERLLRLAVNLGEAEPRTILAGIAKHYGPDELIGKQVVVVANLAPRKMMGVFSHGMVLAASEGDRLRVVTVDDDLPPGSPVR